MATYTNNLRVYWENGKGGLLTIEQGSQPFASYLHIHENEVLQLIEMCAEALNDLYQTPIRRADEDE